MRDYLKLARIGNVVITFLSVECAGIMSGIDVAKSLRILIAAVAASLITAGGNAVNDLFDVEIDRINRPNRPIASGRLSSAKAKAFYLIVTSIGLIASAALNLSSLIIALAAATAISMYSFKLKRSVFWGNFTVAFVTGLAFIYAGSSVDNFKDVYPAAIFAFMANLIREIIKDAEDVKGDSQIGVKTIATRFGTTVSTYLSISLTVILLLMVWAAYALGILPIQFLAVCGLTVLPIAVYITYLLISQRGFSEASFGYKLVMVFGLIALIVGKV
jgi:geranylgeranylglycerol-phosphate geranylgeranyltransferase